MVIFHSYVTVYQRVIDNYQNISIEFVARYSKDLGKIWKMCIPSAAAIFQKLIVTYPQVPFLGTQTWLAKDFLEHREHLTMSLRFLRTPGSMVPWNISPFYQWKSTIECDDFPMIFPTFPSEDGGYAAARPGASGLERGAPESPLEPHGADGCWPSACRSLWPWESFWWGNHGIYLWMYVQLFYLYIYT